MLLISVSFQSPSRPETAGPEQLGSTTLASTAGDGATRTGTGPRPEPVAGSPGFGVRAGDLLTSSLASWPAGHILPHRLQGQAAQPLRPGGPPGQAASEPVGPFWRRSVRNVPSLPTKTTRLHFPRAAHASSSSRGSRALLGLLAAPLKRRLAGPGGSRPATQPNNGGDRVRAGADIWARGCEGT